MGFATHFKSAAVTLAVLLSLGPEAHCAPVRPSQTLKPETVAAWQKAGAKFGYMRTDDDGRQSFHRDDFKPDCRDLPAFAIEWEDFLHCASLPEIEVPFALHLAPREFDYTGKRPPPKQAPAGLVDIDVSNLVRLRYLALSTGEGVDLSPLIHGMQRFQQLEALHLTVGVEFLRKVGDSPRMLSLKEMSVYAAPSEDCLRAVGGLKQLTHLRLSSGTRSGPKEGKPRGQLIGLRHLAGLPALRSVDLAWSQLVTDEELAELMKVPELRELDLSRCELITDKGLNALVGAKKLEDLDIFEGPATNAGWTDAGKMTALRYLRIGGPAVSDAGLGRIASIPNLRGLTLKSCDKVSDAGFAHLAAHRRLESLGLWFCRTLGEEGTRAIGKLKSLRHLRTGYCPGVTDERLDHFSDLLELRELDLRGTPVTDAGVAKLTRFSRLEVLHLWVCPNLTEKCIPSVVKLPKLRVLEFYESKAVKPDDRDMTALGKLPHLRRLTLSNCERVTTDGFRAVAGSPELEELGMRNCAALTDNNLRELAVSRRLKMLTLSGAEQITDAGLESLGALPLRLLWINGCEKVTSKGVEAFQRARPWCHLDIKPDQKRNLSPPVKK
jgi:Leucine Rich repeat